MEATGNSHWFVDLLAEIGYADALLAASKPLAGKLYEEIVGRIKQDDASVPYRLRGYWYYSRYETGKDYPIVARRKGDMQAAEEILLDENAMAEGHAYFSVGDSEVSLISLSDYALPLYDADLEARDALTARSSSSRARLTSTGMAKPIWQWRIGTATQ